eukprot:CAMPEP_0172088286 /NCGR_PEP_ID=MMETSP1043-20130122/23154_1 /TAXON_ID=464988 /ORGANISM="Hemiselmis andersenii, Strain CCMP441" /LENGTH=183 /DNA_ID=CAMNT_0012750583 /DNA_START=26 /DNA_END=573 /DNA_ORIENTATION=-
MTPFAPNISARLTWTVALHSSPSIAATIAPSKTARPSLISPSVGSTLEHSDPAEAATTRPSLEGSDHRVISGPKGEGDAKRETPEGTPLPLKRTQTCGRWSYSWLPGDTMNGTLVAMSWTIEPPLLPAKALATAVNNVPDMVDHAVAHVSIEVWRNATHTRVSHKQQAGSNARSIRGGRSELP